MQRAVPNSSPALVSLQDRAPDRPIVLALHGSASTGRQWSALAEKLSDAVQVIAPDLLGYGKACGRNGSRIAALESTINECGDPVHLVAHSFGGAVALRLAHLHPARIASVTLYDPITAQPIAAGHSRLPGELESIWRQGAAGPASLLMSRFYDFWATGCSWTELLPHQQKRLLRDHASLCRDMEEVSRGDWAIPQYRFGGPVTIFRGQLSPKITADMVSHLASTHNTATVSVLPNLGHFAPLTQPDAVNAHLAPALLQSIEAVATQSFRAA